jgi:hypothetical protein
MSKSEQRINTEILILLREIVIAAGADWCGVQDTINPEESSLLFALPRTGVVLSVKFNPFEFDSDVIQNNVRDRLEHFRLDYANRKISVRASVIEDIRSRVSGIESELREILGGKSGKANS